MLEESSFSNYERQEHPSPYHAMSTAKRRHLLTEELLSELKK